MSEILDFYRQQAIQGRKTTPWLARLQEKALLEFDALSFPNRTVEAWKYTSLDSFQKMRFHRAKPEAIKHSTANPEAANSYNIIIQDGHIELPDSLQKLSAKGLLVRRLVDAIESHPELLQQYLGRALKTEHGFQALNTAMIEFGLFVYLPEGMKLDKPLWISHIQTKADEAQFFRHVVAAAKDSELCLIEDYQAKTAASYFVNAITEVFLGPEAKIQHYKIQRDSNAAYHISHLAVQQKAGSQFDSHSLSLSGKLLRSDIVISLQEPKAKCLMNGIYAPKAAQHIDHHTLVRHEVSDCQSDQDYKGVLGEGSRAVFNGIVYVAKDAQHTVANQQNKNLLLAANAEIDSKPQLEIFADDVICTHGATVGQLDEDALFYMATRGISPEEASRYLVHAFAEDNLKRIENPDLAEWMNRLLNEQLG